MTVHKLALERICPANWLDWDLELLLLGEDSTAAPVVGDLYVADLSPGANELVNTGYTRRSITQTAPTWDGAAFKLTIPTTTWADLTSEGLAPQGVRGAALYVPVTDDDDSWLVASGTFTQVDLDGSDFSVTIDAAGALVVTEA